MQQWSGLLMMLPAESWYSPGTKYQECTADRFLDALVSVLYLLEFYLKILMNLFEF